MFCTPMIAPVDKTAASSKPLRRVAFLIIFATWLISPSDVLAHEPPHGTQPPEKLGTVQFANSCSTAAKLLFNRAVALLHSFWFKAAIDQFDATLKTDPKCAIAKWGIALSLWGNPFAPTPFQPSELIEQAMNAVGRAAASGAGTAREKAYIGATTELWRDAPTRAPQARLAVYTQAMERIAAQYPDDPEASIFYALALASSASPADRTYSALIKAGALLEALFVKQPDHPGIAHYIIHSYDVPPLASKAMDAARRYAQIAPSAPHALHMPSHTFTRVGRWQDSIEMNIASAKAAEKEECAAEELHAMDYQTYAYLQTAQDVDAKRVVERLPSVVGRLQPLAICGATPGFAGVFAAAMIPARYTLERRAWAEAARLEVRPSKAAYPESLTRFARALGLARTGQVAAAREELNQLQTLYQQLLAGKDMYWSGQVDIQRQIAAAWVVLAEGQTVEALELLRKAADAEDATEQSAITPGPLAPARELLGEMLLEAKRPKEALVAFDATLKKQPNRFRAVYGVARAAEVVGDRSKAAEHYRKLIDISAQTDVPARAELERAKRFGK